MGDEPAAVVGALVGRRVGDRELVPCDEVGVKLEGEPFRFGLDSSLSLINRQIINTTGMESTDLEREENKKGRKFHEMYTFFLRGA